MTKSAEAFANARRELLVEYERGAEINISEWISRFPEMLDDLLSYWMLLRATPRAKLATTKVAIRDRGVAERALNRAVETISLGRGWLEDAVDAESDEQAQIGERLAGVRRLPRRSSGKAPIPFRRAAVYAWVAVTLQEQRGSVSRLAAQKVTHLLERGLELGLFQEHRQMPLGPYDSTARYRDAEPIATKQEWLQVVGTQLKGGGKSDDAGRYARNYLRAPVVARALVAQLSRLSDAELETWATAEWVARDLISERKPFDATSIRKRLATIPSWSAKLRKPNFRKEELAAAIEALVRLKIIDAVPRL